MLTRLGNVLYWLACTLALVLFTLSVLLVLAGKAVGLWFTVPVMLLIYLIGSTLRYILVEPMD